MKPWYLVLTLLAWAPIVAIVAFVAFMIADAGIDEVGKRPLKFILLNWRLLMGIVVVKLLAGATLAGHAWSNQKLSASDRWSWTFRLVFFTELRGPAYWLEFIKKS